MALLNSTIKLKQVYDTIAGKGIPDPRSSPAGYGDNTALDIATQAMADIVTERFNWKWNRANATPFATNSWQQDYPQLAQPAGPMAWGEDCDIVDINNTAMPKPLWNISWRRGLSRVGVSEWRMKNICWMYNADLHIGIWPGANVTFYPLITNGGPQKQNPLMSMTDTNGNILIVTTFGTTGSTAPELPAKSNEGTTVTDGSVVWTCVSPTSQGFRVDVLPSATGPSYLILPYYQLEPVTFAGYQQTLGAMPDSFSRHFYRLLEAESLRASTNPNDKTRGESLKKEVLLTLADAKKQGDKEMNIYGLQPATSPVEDVYDRNSGPYTANQPY